MNEEDTDELYRVYGKIAASWLELGQLVSRLDDKKDVERIKGVIAKMKELLDILLFEE